MTDIRNLKLEEGKLIAGRWRVVAQLEEGDKPRFRVRNTEGWDGEMLVLDDLGDLPARVAKLKDLPDHDNIIKSIEAGSWAGFHFLVRQLITGQTVKEWLWREDVLDYDQALGIACQMCLASTQLAKGQIFHLGYEPSWIMVDPQGYVKIDPLLLNSEKDEGYLSPEEIAGVEPDQQSDIFRMGVMIYHMLAGKVPERQGSKVMLESLHQLNPDIPPELDTLLERMTAVSREERPLDAEEVLNVLHPLLMRKPLPRHSVVEDEDAPRAKWYEDKRFWLYIGGGLLLLALLIAMFTGNLNLFSPQK